MKLYAVLPDFFFTVIDKPCLLIQDFDTVMAAIGSNTERWGIFTVTLVLKRYAISNQPA